MPRNLSIHFTGGGFRCALALAASLAVVPHAASAPDAPGEAKAVIQQVNAASTRRDLAALEALMIAEFTWSFGGDANAKQALAEWKSNPKYLDALRRVTGMPCGHDDGMVECPRNARTGFRDGFKETAAGWRMVYFVEATEPSAEPPQGGRPPSWRDRAQRQGVHK